MNESNGMTTHDSDAGGSPRLHLLLLPCVPFASTLPPLFLEAVFALRSGRQEFPAICMDEFTKKHPV